MDPGRFVVWLTVALVTATAVVSGPLVGSVQLVDPDQGDQLFCEPHGTGAVVVEQSPADEFVLRETIGTDQYALDGGEAVLGVSNVTGCLVVTYTVELPALGYKSVKHAYVTADSNERQQLSAVGGNFDRERITEDSYQGMLTIEVRGDENRTIYRENVTVPTGA